MTDNETRDLITRETLLNAEPEGVLKDNETKIESSSDMMVVNDLSNLIHSNEMVEKVLKNNPTIVSKFYASLWNMTR